jgi:hypothetical protein
MTLRRVRARIGSRAIMPVVDIAVNNEESATMIKSLMMFRVLTVRTGPSGMDRCRLPEMSCEDMLESLQLRDAR